VIDRFGIAPSPGDGSTHGSQVNHRRETREILHDDTGWQERNTAGRHARRRPSRQCAQRPPGLFPSIALAQRRFKQDTDRKWQFSEFEQAGVFERLELVDNVLLIPNRENIRDLKISEYMVAPFLLWSNLTNKIV